MKKEWRSGWAEAISAVVSRCEFEELALSYDGADEASRKLSGSYYTPADAARFFWINFFYINEISDAESARSFIAQREFIEPSVGSGILFFALLEAFSNLGLEDSDVAAISVDLVDVNPKAVDFVGGCLQELRKIFGERFLSGVRVHRQDFMVWAPRENSVRNFVFFGNPPFVSEAGSGENLASKFMVRCLALSRPSGVVSLIMPMSLCFSKNYSDLRRVIRNSNSDSHFVNFDNIPDTIFKSGKPLSANTNKANSQRCTFANVAIGGARHVWVTRLIRWRSADRTELLSRAPDYIDASLYAFDDQFPRASSAEMVRYLCTHEAAKGTRTIGDLLDSDGDFELLISGVARNYIGIREVWASGVISLKFASARDFYRALGLVTSRAFFEYWLSLGDGFHVTRGVVVGFPISEEVDLQLERGLRSVRKMWRDRASFSKKKLNRGVIVESYDFAMPALKISLAS